MDAIVLTILAVAVAAMVAAPLLEYGVFGRRK